MCRKCGESDKRGNAADRRARKRFLLDHFGDGITAACVGCGSELNFETVEADRIIPGGSYRRDNVQPACGPCNRTKSNKVDHGY